MFLPRNATSTTLRNRLTASSECSRISFVPLLPRSLAFQSRGVFYNNPHEISPGINPCADWPLITRGAIHNIPVPLPTSLAAAAAEIKIILWFESRFRFNSMATIVRNGPDGKIFRVSWFKCTRITPLSVYPIHRSVVVSGPLSRKGPF